jgi:hypothetical protein
VEVLTDRILTLLEYKKLKGQCLWLMADDWWLMATTIGEWELANEQYSCWIELSKG